MSWSSEDLRLRWARREPAEFEAATISGGRVEAIERAAALIRSWVHVGDTVVDVGCGVGLLADQLDGVTVVGVDFSLSLLSAARGRMPVIQGSAFALPVR